MSGEKDTNFVVLNQRYDFIARCWHRNKFRLVLKNDGMNELQIHKYDLLNL